MTDLNLMHLIVFVWGILTIFREATVVLMANSIAQKWKFQRFTHV